MASPNDSANPVGAPPQSAPGNVVVSGDNAQAPEQPPAPIATAALEAQPGEEDQDDQRVSWQASEFVAHDKSAGWYIILIVGGLLLAIGVFFLTRDLVSVGVVIIAALLLAVYGSHKPRQLEYVIDSRGIGIGQKYHSYEEFRSFSVASEDAFSSLVFMPLRRFALPLTIYYDPADEDRIFDILSVRLPLEEHRLDAVDSLMKRIRF